MGFGLTCEDHGTEVGVWRVCEVPVPINFQGDGFSVDKKNAVENLQFLPPHYYSYGPSIPWLCNK